MSLKKSSSTGAKVALIAVVAFPADDDSSVNVFDTSRKASACVPVICNDLFTSSNRFLSFSNSFELPTNNGMSLSESLAKDSIPNARSPPFLPLTSFLEPTKPRFP